MLLCCAVWISSILSQEEMIEPCKNSFEVRVLLAEGGEEHPVELVNDQGFCLIDFTDPALQEKFSEKKLVIAIKKGALYINNKRLLRDRVTVSAQGGLLELQGNKFQGTFVIIKIDSIFYLVNYVDLEDYVFSVLRWESWPGWPLEVNKAFAIMCRSYVLAKVLEARNKHAIASKKLLYDIQATNIHQTYKGTHGFDDLRMAVAQTNGMIMTHHKKPIIAMYDCCCGGLIPAHMEQVNFADAPYLARDYACVYCKKCKLFNWRLEFNRTQFEALLKQQGLPIADITHIAVSKRDKAGVVQEVSITTRSDQHVVTGKKIYSLFKDIKSYCYSIIKKGTKIIFEKGKGFGHHLGLCQWGAREMVRQGWRYKKILQYYYPGVTFMKVEVVERA